MEEATPIGPIRRPKRPQCIITPMNRITSIFQNCRREKRAALIIFAEAGYPDLAQSEKDIDTAIENGADIIELGIPFSDPMAEDQSSPPPDSLPSKMARISTTSSKWRSSRRRGG